MTTRRRSKAENLRRMRAERAAVSPLLAEADEARERMLREDRERDRWARKNAHLIVALLAVLGGRGCDRPGHGVKDVSGSCLLCAARRLSERESARNIEMCDRHDVPEYHEAEAAYARSRGWDELAELHEKHAREARERAARRATEGDARC